MRRTRPVFRIPDSPAVGQRWRRRDGSTFKIESVKGNYVWYWLASGSRPQIRSVRKDLLLRNYKRVRTVQ